MRRRLACLDDRHPNQLTLEDAYVGWSSGSLFPSLGEDAIDPLVRLAAADLFIMATDAEAVFLDFGKPSQPGIRRASPAALRARRFPAGSMGPKVAAACHFAEATGHTAAIGALADIPGVVSGKRGTLVDVRFDGLTFHPRVDPAHPAPAGRHLADPELSRGDRR